MKKISFTALVFLMSVPVIFAQSREGWAGKTYFGHLHHYAQSHGSFWHVLFGKRSISKDEEIGSQACSIEFKSPLAFAHESVTQMPDELAYVIKFKDGPGVFKKFIIKIYTNNGEDYTVDPDEAGKEIGSNGDHHIFDTYLIYLILGQDINHFEIISRDGNNNDKYILDQWEIRNDA